MKTVYLNMKTSHGVETVDEFTQAPRQSSKKFREYIRRMIGEYRIAGMAVYQSTRPTKAWKERQ